MIEIGAARQALEQQIAQTKAAYEHQVLDDLSDAEKKVAEFNQDLVKAEQKVDENGQSGTGHGGHGRDQDGTETGC